MDVNEVRTCIDSIRRTGSTPDAASIAANLAVPPARVRELLRANPTLNAYLLDVRAQIRSERKADFARQQRAAYESGAYVPYKEPQDFGRRIHPADIAKNPKYWPTD